MARFPTISENLVQLLLENPEKYYDELCDLKNKYNMELIKKIIDCTHYESYMGNHLHSLIYVVGDLFYEETKEKNIFGSKITVSEDLGIKILDKLVEYNIDLYNENYYKETPIQNLKSDGYTKRKNNLKFKKKLEKYYIDDLNNGLSKSLKN